MPVTDEMALIESFVLRVQLICRQLQLVHQTIAGYEHQIAQAYAAHPDHEIFASLPGAGPVLGPRLLASLGSQRERFGAAAELQHYTGIAPVTKRSGSSGYNRRRPQVATSKASTICQGNLMESSWAAGLFCSNAVRTTPCGALAQMRTARSSSVAGKSHPLQEDNLRPP